MDILPKRYDYYLTNYFKSYPGEEREKVRYFVSDMWRPYASAASAWFPNAMQIIDKYHWIRQVGWAFEGVRKEAQKEMSPQRRRYFKRSKRLLSKRESRLTDTQREEVHVMRFYSDPLSRAYQYKEDFFDIVDLDNAQEARKELGNWIYRVSKSEIPQFTRAGRTMQNWFGGIVNSYTTTITNGFQDKSPETKCLWLSQLWPLPQPYPAYVFPSKTVMPTSCRLLAAACRHSSFLRVYPNY